MTKAEVKAVLQQALGKMAPLYWQAAPREAGRCLVWGETGPARNAAADNHPEDRGLRGIAELYTDEEEDPLFDTIESALAEAGLLFTWESSGYDRDVGMAKHRWRWETL